MTPISKLQLYLDKLEEQETKLLSWGDTEGFFTKSELMDLFESTNPGYDPEDVLFDLLDHAMIVRSPDPDGREIYRTRMGEAVHLYRNLRQWFLGKPIDQARTLVSDFRFVRRPRSYPLRELTPEALISESRHEFGLAANETDAIQSLLHPMENFRLAGFQERSFKRIIQAWRHHNRSNGSPSGTIVCAGTGSGKTLAFYLPAMTELADDLCSNSEGRVRILAIYPRKELLKDQFMETWEQSRKLDPLLSSKAGRKIRIGALFGDTPFSISDAKSRTQKQSNSSLDFDLLRCKTRDCSGKMRWSQDHIAQGKEVLTCSSCNHSVGEDEIGLTRQTLQKKPPDILFTTTEMLNQNLANHYQNHLFGVGPSKGPTLVLLDEVHTYGGNTGAQAAYLLRRWMQFARCRPHFVGLSATLADAENFFAELIGAQTKNVELVEPKSDEMVEEGSEYMLALRGDPVSQTSLLSTTIQASMLTRRILDNQDKVSKGTWGEKCFVFTDDLDVNNRLYHQLADAEGWKTSWRGLTPNREPLASLRGPNSPAASDPRRKIMLGQDWRISQDIGHSISVDDRARVARTSSQDSGVDVDGEIIVATASLEVGFNDPSVGAVIQHKAPRDVASYMQRKGRAGRLRTMRPWMLAVLSEFGRDRVAFQRYEELISPEIKRQGLPIGNGHIQKMQASMAALDWLGAMLGRGSIWSILKKPTKNAAFCKSLLKLVDGVLSEGKLQNQFISYIQKALRLEGAESLQRILWSPPRSIMMEFLPSLRRNLSTNWREYGVEWAALRERRSPAPEFIPDALFSELNIPNLAIALERGRDRHTSWEYLAFIQGLREFAPGRISKRYAIDSNYEADWLVPESFNPAGEESVEVDFDVHSAFGPSIIEEGFVSTREGNYIPVYRPSEVRTKALDPALNLTERSNAQHRWQAFYQIAEDTPIHKPPTGCWDKYLSDVTFCTHQQMTPLDITRYTTGSKASLRYKSGNRSQVVFNWVQGGQPVGIGTRQWVDGARFRFRIDEERICQITSSSEVLKSLRPVYFRYLVENMECFENEVFQADWVTECYLAALAEKISIVENGTELSIRDAIQNLGSENGRSKLRSVPLSLFQPSDQEEAGEEQELQRVLRSLLADQYLISDLEKCAEALWKDPLELEGFSDWAREVLGNTLAAAAQQTLCSLLPDVDERAVVCDSEWEGADLSVWMSESEPGGSGVVSRLSRVYLEDPVKALNVFARSLEPGDYEQIDYDLYALLNSVVSSSPLTQALDGVRGAENHQQRRLANSDLHNALKQEGFSLSHSFVTVLYSRILRPASNSQTDNELKRLLNEWRDLEEGSGLEWPLNIAAHTLAKKDLGLSAGDDEVFRRFCRYQGLLWPRGHDIRQAELNYYNPFHGKPLVSERLLGASLFGEDSPQIFVSGEDWLAQTHEALRRIGRVDLTVPREQLDDISSMLAELQLQPVDLLGLYLYPRVGSIRRSQGDVVFRVELAEALQ